MNVKKILSLFLILMLICLCGCADSKDKTNVTDVAKTVTSSDKDSQTKTDKDANNTQPLSEQTLKEDSKSAKTESKGENKSASKQNQTTQNSLGGAPTTSSNNSPEENNTGGDNNNATNSGEQQITTPSKADDLASSLGEPEDDMNYHLYELNGTVVEWFLENEFVHIIFKNVNRYTVFDTTSGALIKDKPLDGRPADIHNYGNELWISYPDLKCIKIYNKDTFSVKKSMHFEHAVSSFGVCGEYLIYTEDDQHVKAYRYNMNTSELINIKPNVGWTFSRADVLINEEHKLVYFGESGSTGSKIFCFDIASLELQSFYSKDNYGYSNLQRRSFLLDGFVYWGEFKLNALNVSQVDAQYSGRFSAGMLHVDDNFVVTTIGIYLKDTCEQLVACDVGYSLSMLAITKTSNIVMIEEKELCIVSMNN